MIKEESLNYNEDVTSRSKDELEKITKVDDDAQNLRILVVKEDEPTSPESQENIKDEIVKTSSEMALWGEMDEELKIEEVTPTSEVKECIIKLCKEMEATCEQQINKNNNKIVEDCVLKLLIEHNYRLLEKDGG